MTREKRLEKVAAWARIISDHMRPTPGGDAVEFTGSTNDVDTLRDVLDDLDYHDHQR